MQEILNERGQRYGSFADNAALSQRLKQLTALHPSTDPALKEAMEMICHKISRIVNGDPGYVDSWTDIAGYAALAVQWLTFQDQTPSTPDALPTQSKPEPSQPKKQQRNSRSR